MKLLMIGMDGVQSSTFKRGWTPFIESLISRGSTLELEEDLMSRGWAEIFTGRHGTETGTLYERPMLDGSYQWTDKCRLDEIPGLGTEIKPLWQVLNERGYRVGVMNVPTTNPAPKVDGFFVSGGGGGRGVKQEVCLEQCYPHEVKDTLDSMQYVVDERLNSLLIEKKLFNPFEMFSKLDFKNRKRTECFIALANEYSVDFGFVVFKSSTVLTESLVLPELQRNKLGKGYNAKLLDAGRELFEKLDKHVQRLVEAFPEAQILLVSDHSTEAREYSVNFNALLQELGFQKPSEAKRGGLSIIKRVKKLLPKAILKKLKGMQGAENFYRSLTTFNEKESLAFSVTEAAATHGIFINDESRFKGSVKTEEKHAICEKLVIAINENKTAREHNFKAYLPKSPIGVFSSAYPDIVVKMPAGYMPSNESTSFITSFDRKDIPIDLSTIMQSGCRVSVKGYYPLAVVVGGKWQCSVDKNPADLRLIYEHICKYFEQRCD